MTSAVDFKVVVPARYASTRLPAKPLLDLGGNIAQPQQRTGLALVFRVFERASYALIMESSEVVNVADVVRNP